MTSKTLTMKLKERQKQGKPLFVPYIMAGANGLERLPAEIELLTTHGAGNQPCPLPSWVTRIMK